MADITACTGKGCPVNDTCYRYTCDKSRWQSYFATIPIKEDGTCNHYVEDERDKKEDC